MMATPPTVARSLRILLFQGSTRDRAAIWAADLLRSRGHALELDLPLLRKP